MAPQKSPFGNVRKIACAAIFAAIIWSLAALTPVIFAAPDNKPAVPPSPGAKSADQELPKPEDVTLMTDDRVQLVLTYYRGARGRESIPMVLLHGYGSRHNRTDYTKFLAPFLQSKGFAVVAPDLRGHGASTRIKTPYGRDETLEAAYMGPNQLNLMVLSDMKAVKQFLWDKNNAGELNIDKLCIIGEEMGASIAMEFAYYDALQQDANPVLRPEYKLGRFVKALVLISPETSFKGLTVRRTAQNPAVRNDISVLILVGEKDERALGEAKRIYSIFDRDRPRPDPNKKSEQQSLFLSTLDTNLQGSKILEERNLKADELIDAFINLRLVKNDQAKTWSWRQRKLPHQ